MPQAHKSDVTAGADFTRRNKIRVADIGTADRSIQLFFILVAVTAFLATMLLVEDNLFDLAWRTLWSLLASDSHQISFAMVFIAGAKSYQPR